MLEGLQRVEAMLGKDEFMAGNSLTEADIRLYTTILRFDPVYFGHFKCNLLAIRDCPNILRWLRKVTAIKGVRETINMEHIKVLGFYCTQIRSLTSPTSRAETLLHVSQTNQSHSNCAPL